MKKLTSITFVVLVLLSSCASTTPGRKQSTSSESVSAYAKIVDDFSDENIFMYQVSLKNNERTWITLEQPEILTPTPEKLTTATILTQEKLKAWIESKNLENAVRAYNTQIALASLGLAGGIAFAAGGGDAKLSNWGAGVYLGSFTALAVNEILSSKRAAEFQSQLPEGHLLNKIILPPNKVVQRWILIEYKYKKPELIQPSSTVGFHPQGAPAHQYTKPYDYISLQVKYRLARESVASASESNQQAKELKVQIN